MHKCKNSGDEMLPVKYWPDNRKVNGENEMPLL
jgi:hypothetical protein